MIVVLKKAHPQPVVAELLTVAQGAYNQEVGLVSKIGSYHVLVCLLVVGGIERSRERLVVILGEQEHFGPDLLDGGAPGHPDPEITSRK